MKQNKGARQEGVAQEGDTLYWRGTKVFEHGDLTPEYQKYQLAEIVKWRNHFNEVIALRERELDDLKADWEDCDPEWLIFVADNVKILEARLVEVYSILHSGCKLLNLELDDFVSFPDELIRNAAQQRIAETYREVEDKTPFIS